MTGVSSPLPLFFMISRLVTRGAIFLGLAALCLAPRANAAEGLQTGDVVAICGDSITEQKIFSVYMADYFLMCQPAAGMRAHQIGWSGEAATGLLKRIEADVLPFKPTVATTLYGMNDGGYNPSNPATIAAFRENTEGIIRKLQAGGVRFVLIGSPGAVDSEKFKGWRLAKTTPEGYNQTLADLGVAAKQAAEKTGAAFVDVHTPMMAAMAKAKAKYGADYPFGMDGVHPSFNGHLVMAYAFLKGLGCNGEIGTLTFDAKAGTATATDGHKVLKADKAGFEVESSRYPFCFVDDPTNKESTRAVLDCVPFNEELNRFKLVVKNFPAARATVKWGLNEKVFTAAQLAEGINLAAEFLDNPFSEKFASVEAAVKAQQAFETPATKALLHSLPAWQSAIPEEKAALEKLQGAVVEKSRGLAEAASKLVVPVKHALTITPVM